LLTALFPSLIWKGFVCTGPLSALSSPSSILLSG
jgi:hypothetical protein